MTERLHQSTAKILVTEGALVARRKLDRERDHGTLAMQNGSLLDYLVFSSQDKSMFDKYEVVRIDWGTYASGPRKGQPREEDWANPTAREVRDAIAATGKLPVLLSQVTELESIVVKLQARLARELRGWDAVFQQTIRWTSDMGVECEGTPDVVAWKLTGDTMCAKTIDLKRTAYIGRSRVAKQIHNMGWDLQAAAYREAAVALVRDGADDDMPVTHVGHTLICAEDGGDRVQRYPLDEVYLEVGKRRWEQGQRIWQECQATGNWPDDSEDPISPPMYIVRKEIEAFEAFEEEP